jgi:hypothetical protein
MRLLEFPVVDKPSVIDPDIIEVLEEALELAKAGSITDLAIAFKHSDKQTTTCFHGNNRFAMLGAVEYLAHRMKCMIHEDD